MGQKGSKFVFLERNEYGYTGTKERTLRIDYTDVIFFGPTMSKQKDVRNLGKTDKENLKLFFDSHFNEWDDIWEFWWKYRGYFEDAMMKEKLYFPRSALQIPAFLNDLTEAFSTKVIDIFLEKIFVEKVQNEEK